MPSHTKCCLLFLFMLLMVLHGNMAVAAESMPPIIPEGERIEDIEQLIGNVTRRTSYYSVAFSPDGRMIAAGASDGTIRLWNVYTGKELRRIKGHSGRVNSVTFSPDGQIIASGSDDNTVRLWDTATGKKIWRLKGHFGTVNSVVFSPDGQMIASGAWDKTILLWNVATGKQIRRLKRHSGIIYSVVFSPDSRMIASGSTDNTVRLWDVATGKEIRRLQGHSDNVVSVAFSPDGQMIASGAWDKTILLWNVATGKQIRRFEGYSGNVNSVAFSSDGQMIVFGADDNTVRLWDAATGKEIRRFEGHSDYVRSVAFSPDGQMIVFGADDNTVRLWDAATGKEIRRFEGHSDYVQSVAFSPDGQMIASGANLDEFLILWDAATGKEIRRLEGHYSDVESVVFSPDGQMIVSVAERDTFLILWDAATGKEIRRLEGHYSNIFSVGFSPDGQMIASGSADSTVRLWDTTTGKEIRRLKMHPDVVIDSVAFSPDGQIIASSSFEDASVYLWNTATGKEIRRLQTHSDGVISVTFSPDGQIIAAEDNGNNTIRLLNTSTGNEIRRLEGHSKWVSSVAFSPDGQTIISGSSDGTTRLWDVATGKELRRFIGGQRGTWVAYDVQKKTCLRYDDGTLLVNTQINPISPVLPPEPDSPANLKIQSPPSLLITKDGQATEFTLTATNTGKGKMYWLDITQSPKERKNSPLIFHPPPTTVILKPGETTELPCKVSAYSPYNNPKGRNTTLHLQVTTAHGEPILLDIPVQIRVPSFEIIQSQVQRGEKKTLLVSLKNAGLQALDTATNFQAVLAGTALDTVTRNQIKAGEIINLSFALPESLKPDKTARLDLSIRKNDFPVHEWTFPGQPVILPRPLWQIYSLLLALLVAASAALYYLRLFRHPLTVALSDAPEKIIRTPIDQLPDAYYFLRRTRRLKTVLSAVSVEQTGLQNAISFFQNPAPRSRCGLVTERLCTACEPLQPAPFPVFRFRMPSDFMLNVDHCFIAFPPQEMPASQVLASLRSTDAIRMKTCLIITTRSKQQAKLRAASADIENWFVTPDNRELTALFLSSDAHEALARIIAAQIRFSRISPYQTKGGINRESIFFGRNRLLAHIMQREPSNYLIVGGRQLGKSSLLKAIQRRYADDPRIECRYMVLSGPDVAGQLADALNLPPKIETDALFAAMRENAAEKRRLFLIDEADRFIEAEAASGYPMLHRFRALSEEGRCYFILAGFWGLYRAATFDYQSPVKNFAETLNIGALEPDACRKLATLPMQTLGLRYQSDNLVETMLAQTGGRANLIAIACDEILHGLKSRNRFLLKEKDVLPVLDGNAIRSALAGWEMLTGLPDADRLDRIIVYTTVSMETFTLPELFGILEKHGYSATPEAVRQSLQRLELAYILRRKKQQYTYCVPLFRKIVLEQEPDMLLRQELRSLDKPQINGDTCG